VPLWLIIVLVVLLALVVGGIVAANRRLARTRGSFDRHLAQVNRDLAAALAEDRGWDPVLLEAAVRREWEARGPDVEPDEITLYEVLDRPGTVEDKAVYRIAAGGRSALLTLGRHDGEWTFDSLEELAGGGAPPPRRSG
jgi:hypothetical protein